MGLGERLLNAGIVRGRPLLSLGDRQGVLAMYCPVPPRLAAASGCAGSPASP